MSYLFHLRRIQSCELLGLGHDSQLLKSEVDGQPPSGAEPRARFSGHAASVYRYNAELDDFHLFFIKIITDRSDLFNAISYAIFSTPIFPRPILYTKLLHDVEAMKNDVCAERQESK